jgi:hypothetical protein
MLRVLSRLAASRGQWRPLRWPVVVLSWGSLLSAVLIAGASTPASENVTVPTADGQTVVTVWTGVAPAGANGASDCTLTADPQIDHHLVNLTVPAGTYDSVNISATFHVEWDDGGQDLILTLTQDGNFVDSNDGGSPQENVGVSNPAQAQYDAMVCPFAAGPGSTPYRGKLTLTATSKGSTKADTDKDGVPDDTDQCPGTPPRTAVDEVGCPYPPLPPGEPRYFIYKSPPGTSDAIGEPSIGCNWQSEKTFSNTNVDGSTNTLPNGGTATFFGGFAPHLARVTFDDCQSPANATWERKPLLSANTPRAFGDPILFTDHDTGRTWVVQLEGLTPAGSTIDITDDDGDTFIPSDGTAGSSDLDHETLAAGPYHQPIPPDINPVYQNATYYASQSIAEARVQRSDNGGLSFLPGTLLYSIATCGGLHGHLKVANDGTVYVPNAGCGGQQAVVVSENNAVSWTVRKIPGSTAAARSDPSVAVATDSKTLYVCMESGNGHPTVSVSKDNGVTWTSSTPFDLGASVTNGGPVVDSAFPAAVAGDPDRAACAFFGTETGGGSTSAVWYLYVTSTFDGGATWTTQNITPADPIQRGQICGSGQCRNLLDFFDATIDKEGRVLIAGEDGCVTDQCIDGGPNDWSAKGFIPRQSGGRRMYAAFDPVEPALPGAPALTGGLNADMTVANLSWSAPDGGGVPVTAYNVYHRVGTSGPFALLATVPGTSYSDATFDKTFENFYHVTAVNAVGEGPYCIDFSPSSVILETVCELPGVTVVTDDKGDQQGGPEFDIEHIKIAEPESLAGKIAITFKVAGFTGGIVPSGTRWAIRFNGPNPPPAGQDDFFIAMTTERSDTPEFVYGTTGVVGAARVFTIEGNLDGASRYSDDGTILLVLDRNNPMIGPLAGGDTLINGFPSVRAPATPGNAGIYDQGGNFFYTLRADDACFVNTPPVAVLDASQASGYAPLDVTFDASGSSDADAGDTLTYSYDFGDESGSDQPVVTHTYTEPGDYTAILTVRDSHGASSTVSVPIKVTPPPVNHPPVANAGADTQIDEGATALLYGGGSSDEDDDQITYEWTQVSGPAVALQDADTATPKFVAPQVNADTLVAFTLVVTDSHGVASLPDEVAVDILDQLPVAQLGGNNTVGGALPPLALMALGLFGLARRRRG